MKMFRFSLWLAKKKRSMRKRWYELMKPVANWLREREDKKYIKQRDATTKEDSIRAAVKSVKKRLAESRDGEVCYLVCDHIHTDELPGYDRIGDFYFDRHLKREKDRRAVSALNWIIDNQEAVIEALKKVKGISVKEELTPFTYEISWGYIKNYKKTCIVTVD